LGNDDKRLQSCSYRISLSEGKGKIPFYKPNTYESQNIDFFRQLARATPDSEKTIQKLFFNSTYNTYTYRSPFFNMAPIANNKRDLNSGHSAPLNTPMLTEKWINGDQKVRSNITKDLAEYTKSILYFCANDNAVPTNIREFFRGFGYCNDEFIENNNFPTQIYIREGRRLIGDRVFTLDDILVTSKNSDQSIGLANYPIDCKPARWYRKKTSGILLREGMIFKNYNKYYHLPYWLMLPKRTECVNLLVPVAVSASHVSYSSIRMEPHWMQLGEAAGRAAAVSIARNIPLHSIAFSEFFKDIKNNTSVRYGLYN